MPITTSRLRGKIRALVPGVAVCVLISTSAIAAQLVEALAFGHPYVEALVLAILLGTALRSVWEPAPLWRAGIAFSAKQMLEAAVMLLGASISLTAIVGSGPVLLAAIAVTVIVTLASSYAISRLLGLAPRLSILIACGNSICGNSAIAAVAPIIGADSDDIVSSISFTAVLGVVVVLGLPLLIPLLGLSAKQYGVVAGLTVYAVPQVLAATLPAGLVSTQTGTLVKLVRVLMLGPVVLAFSLFASRMRDRDPSAMRRTSVQVFSLVPWFIVGFLALAGLRSFQLVPDWAVGPLTKVAAWLTIISMAALGLGVDVRVLGRVGGRVTAAVTLSLVVLLSISIGIIEGLTL